MKKITPIISCKNIYQKQYWLVNTLLLSCLILASSCKNTVLPIKDNLTSAGTWEIQSYSVFKSTFDEPVLIGHYKNIGKFIFKEDGTGQLIDDTDNFHMTWILDDFFDGTGIITFNISKEEIENYSNPFIFYYLGGLNPFYTSEEYFLSSYEISRINDFTYVISWEASNYGSGGAFENIEFVITKLEE